MTEEVQAIASAIDNSKVDPSPHIPRQENVGSRQVVAYFRDLLRGCQLPVDLHPVKPAGRCSNAGHP
jgi:hypothetical protein